METSKRGMTAEEMIGLLACPVTGSGLRREGEELVSLRGGFRYPIRDGIPVLLREEAVVPDGVEGVEAWERSFDPV